MAINHSFSLPLLVITALAATTHAAPITYTINFSSSLGDRPTSGGFTYDTAAAPTSAFSGFTILWNTLTLDFTSAANNYITTPAGGCPGDGNGSAVAFSIMSGSLNCGTSITRRWNVLAGGIGNNIESFFQIFGTTGKANFGPTIPQPPFFFTSSSRGDFTITATTSSIPEPGTMSITMLGVVALGWARRRKQLQQRTYGKAA